MVKKAAAGRANHRSRVTFEMPATVKAQQVHLCGDFNGWSQTATPLVRRKDGRFSTTITLETGRAYCYRYVLDGQRWEYDWAADAYVANPRR